MKQANCIGYPDTWLAVQHCKDKHGTNPVGFVAPDFNACRAKDKLNTISFPVLSRIWKK